MHRMAYVCIITAWHGMTHMHGMTYMLLDGWSYPQPTHNMHVFIIHVISCVSLYVSHVINSVNCACVFAALYIKQTKQCSGML
jgi:hypothetical protein